MTRSHREIARRAGHREHEDGDHGHDHPARETH